MPTKTRLDSDAEAPADAAPVADTVPAVEAAAPQPVAAQPEEEQRLHPDDLWQTGPWTSLTYVGDPKVYIPLGALRFGVTRPVPASLAESYLATGDFVPAAA